jgi:hypothetical protein
MHAPPGQMTAPVVQARLKDGARHPRSNSDMNAASTSYPRRGVSGYLITMPMQAVSRARTDHRLDQGPLPHLGRVWSAENTELEHGAGNTLDSLLDDRPDRVRSRKRHGGGHPGREFVILRHDGLDRRNVVVGDHLSLLDRPDERGRQLRVLLRPGSGGDLAVDG